MFFLNKYQFGYKLFFPSEYSSSNGSSSGYPIQDSTQDLIQDHIIPSPATSVGAQPTKTLLPTVLQTRPLLIPHQRGTDPDISYAGQLHPPGTDPDISYAGQLHPPGTDRGISYGEQKQFQERYQRMFNELNNYSKLCIDKQKKIDILKEKKHQKENTKKNWMFSAIIWSVIDIFMSGIFGAQFQNGAIGSLELFVSIVIPALIAIGSGIISYSNHKKIKKIDKEISRKEHKLNNIDKSPQRQDSQRSDDPLLNSQISSKPPSNTSFVSVPLVPLDNNQAMMPLVGSTPRGGRRLQQQQGSDLAGLY